MTSRVLTRSLVTGALGTALILAAAAPSSAERWTHRDPSHDVVQSEVGPAPGVRQGDITRVSMNYRRGAFVLKVKVRELHRERYSSLVLFLTVPHPGHRPTQRLVQYYFTLDDGTDVGAADPRTGFPVDCRPVTAARDYRAGTLRITVPRDCLGDDPAEVRAGTYFRDAWRDLHGAYVYVDDGLRKGARRSYDYSPLLSRG